ncbi:MAG: energy transducer TonB [bacterium]|nr:energy transducer TonB [bacterium]
MSTFIAISLLMHAVLILLIPKFRPQDLPMQQIGGSSSATQVHLIQSRPLSSPVQKKKARPQARGDLPAPEIDPRMLERLKTVRDDIKMPSFAPPWPKQKETLPLPHRDKTLEDELIDQPLPDEIASQQQEQRQLSPRHMPAPQPPPLPKLAEEPIKRENKKEDVIKPEDILPKPEPEEIDFGDDEEAAEEVSDASLSSSFSPDIEWSGKPRRILYKPAYPPRYPEGYRGQTQGRIKLKFWVDSQGYVVRVVPMQKLDPRLDVVATEYLRQYRFEPISRGKGELEWGIIPFSFRLE